MTTNHPANGPVSLDRLHQISEILSKQQHKATAVISATQWLML